MTARTALDFAIRNATYVIFACVLIYFGVQAPIFLGPESLGNIVKQSSFIGIAAVGMTFVLLTGGIDLSVGSAMYLGSLVAGMAMKVFGLGIAEGLLIAVLAGVAMGIFNALFIVGLRVIPFIVSLATLFLFRGIGVWLTSSEQFDFTENMRSFGLSHVLGIPTPILFFAGTAVAGYILMARTTFGRQVYAIGNDREAAHKAGVNTGWVEARVYILSSACAALSGFVLIAQIGRLDTGFGEGREFDVIAAAVLGGASLFGGVGTAMGAVIGATLIQTVKLGLVFTGVNLYLQPMMQGLIIFIAVLMDGAREHRVQTDNKRNIRPT
jgi:ribose transport system permease protein